MAKTETATATEATEATAPVRGIKDGNVLSKQRRQLSAGELKLGFVGPNKRQFVCEVVPDVTIEDLQSDAFFAHVGLLRRPRAPAVVMDHAPTYPPSHRDGLMQDRHQSRGGRHQPPRSSPAGQH